MKIALIPCATSEWREEGRLLGRVEVTPTPQGERDVASWAETLRPLGLLTIHHAADELSTRTAKIIAKALDIKSRKVANLAEVDVGLWAGLTDDDLQKRYATAYRELCESPLNVNPPNGETIADAQQRLTVELQKLLKKNGVPAIALVERPLALALTRSSIEGGEEAAIWENARDMNIPLVLEYPQ